MEEEPREKTTAPRESTTTTPSPDVDLLNLQELCSQLKKQVDHEKKQKDAAQKEKEAMVIKYAIGEKTVLEQKHQYEQLHRKYKDVTSENERMQHKIKVASNEKSRICQMLDDKIYELKTSQLDVERLKSELSNMETNLKWSQTSLKTEIQLHKECQHKVDDLNSQLKNITEQIDGFKKEAQDSIETFRTSQENRAFLLDEEVKQQKAAQILLKHDRDETRDHLTMSQLQLEKLQKKHQETLEENNELSLKVQELEKKRLEHEQKLSEFKACIDQDKQDCVDLQAKTALLDQLNLQLKNEQDRLQTANEQMDLIKARNAELEVDIAACREREAELLLFTRQLTDKNVRLQSEFTALETKIQQLTCEQTLAKRSVKESETRKELALLQKTEECNKYKQELEGLRGELEEKSKLCEQLDKECASEKEENKLLRRKFELATKEMNKELQQCRKKLDKSEKISKSSSDLSLGEPTKYEVNLDQQTLIEHIVKLQKNNARKAEKLDFLEEHVNTLVLELQKKTKLLQSYILKEQAGTFSVNSTDNSKASMAKLNGIDQTKIPDNMTLELSVDINRRLQIVLEDSLLKNMTLKESVDTLGREIDRLNQLVGSNNK